jgi:hypothetical protein
MLDVSQSRGKGQVRFYQQLTDVKPSLVVQFFFQLHYCLARRIADHEYEGVASQPGNSLDRLCA